METDGHDFGEPVDGHVRMCSHLKCIQMAVAEGGSWREPTGTELLDITATMLEDIGMAEAMMLIHGRERGLARYRDSAGYASVEIDE